MEIQEEDNLIIMEKEEKQEFEDSKRLFESSISKLKLLKSEGSLPLDKFLEYITFIKRNAEKAILKLKTLLMKFETNSSTHSYVFTVYNFYTDKLGLVLMDLNLLLNSNFRSNNDIRKEEVFLIDKLRNIKEKETYFITDFKSNKIEEFKDVFNSYDSLIDEFYTSFFNHIEKNKNNDFINRKYFQLTEKIMIDSFSYNNLDKTINHKNILFLVKYLDVLRSIIDEYYQSKENVNILNIITKKLNSFAKSDKLGNFSKDLDKSIENLFNLNNNQISEFFEDISGMFKKDEEKKKTGCFLFFEIFRNLNRINIEIDIKNNYQDIILNQYYQFSFYLLHVKMTFRILFSCLFKTNEIRINKFHLN